MPEVQARLHEVNRGLRDSGAADLGARQTLAELVDELTAALASANVPPADMARLVESVATWRSRCTTSATEVSWAAP